MPDFVVAWDLETVPDLEAYAASKGLVGRSADQLRAEMGNSFPKLPLHRIVCIGALIAERTSQGWLVKAIGAPHIGQRSERELIEAFVERINELSPKLVTFAGAGFDLPVLRYRAMKHSVSAPALSKRPYFNRYTEDAVDLCDVLASFDARGRITLDELSRILGFAGKPAGMEGSQVEQYFSEGKIEEIAKYCESDIINTYRIWLRLELFRGALSTEQYYASENSLAAVRPF